MPRGGRRTGSGRKPKTPTQALTLAKVVAIDGGRSDEPSKMPPKDLPAEQQDFWRAYAAAAIGAGTLTAQTVGSFRLLCELDAEKTATKAVLDKDGRTYIKVIVDGAGQEHQELKAHPLMSQYRQLAQRVEALMARFGLAPFGKPVACAGGKRKQTVSPWMSIAAAKNVRA